MTVTNDFLPDDVFKRLQDYCKESEFEIVSAGGKEFSVLDIPEEVASFLELEDHEIVLAFIRNAYNEFDNKERIHCDGIIMDRRINKASVLYINNNSGVTKNGTKFYSHKKHGLFLPDEAGEEEFNRLIEEDSDDTRKWVETHYVKAKPNRRLLYNARYFHGKYPAKIKEGVRIVLVCFYAKKE